jgi:hypothetical protein
MIVRKPNAWSAALLAFLHLGLFVAVLEAIISVEGVLAGRTPPALAVLTLILAIGCFAASMLLDQRLLGHSLKIAIRDAVLYLGVGAVLGLFFGPTWARTQRVDDHLECRRHAPIDD